MPRPWSKTARNKESVNDWCNHVTAGDMADGGAHRLPVAPLFVSDLVSGQASTRDQRRRTRFTPATTQVDAEVSSSIAAAAAPAQAPAGFYNVTNGFDPQGPAFNILDEDNAVALRSFNDNRFIFEEVEDVADGLGPTYNAQSCRECHQNVVTGGASQVTEQRTGHRLTASSSNRMGGSLIQSRATHPEIANASRSRTTSARSGSRTNMLGDGFVEAIANRRCSRIRDAPAVGMRGTAVMVPVLEANGAVARSAGSAGRTSTRSLQSFAADAYLNEMGITSPLLPTENTSSGPATSTAATTRCADPEDDGDDVNAFATSCARPRRRRAGAITTRTSSPARQLFNAGRLQHLPRADDHDGAAGNGHQRRRAHGAGRARQQDHPSVQRLPAARHRHRRRHPIQPTAEFAADGEPDADGAALGPADAQPAHARRAHVHAGRSDPAPRRAGVGGHEPLSELSARPTSPTGGVSQFAVSLQAGCIRGQDE